MPNPTQILFAGPAERDQDLWRVTHTPTGAVQDSEVHKLVMMKVLLSQNLQLSWVLV